MNRLLPALAGEPGPAPALITPEAVIDYRELGRRGAALAGALSGAGRVAVWAPGEASACIGVVGALGAGAAAVPISPNLGPQELAHVLADSRPKAVVAAPSATLPSPLAELPLIPVPERGEGGRVEERDEPAASAPALILYTSGTTGPPKGVVISRRALAADIDGLARAWDWTGADVVAHALPLVHAHGLVLGVLGPLRLGGATMLLGRFSPAAVASALWGEATMLFGVPTMYRRLRLAAEEDPALAGALAEARLLVSGSAALPVAEHVAIERLTGQRVVERYGMTETLITAAARADGPRTPGEVGPPVPGVELRLVDDAGQPLSDRSTDPIGELEVRGPTVFDGYLNQPAATSAAFHDGWFKTGDLADRREDDSLRILGRRGTDLIKTGGYRVGAGEVEAALAEHPDVDEVAVTGEPDDDLGQRIVAWVVPITASEVTPEGLIDHVTGLLSAHKRPREVRFLDSLPRNLMGKVQKSKLSTAKE